ncbi:12378_t:CDS:10 [Entrophospora sp. SA101]|nr:12378_t:CDS:10 [Entrophospora sp. SA101]
MKELEEEIKKLKSEKQTPEIQQEVQKKEVQLQEIKSSLKEIATANTNQKPKSNNFPTVSMDNTRIITEKINKRVERRDTNEENKEYNFTVEEGKNGTIWTNNQTFFAELSDKSKPKKYILAMFPYPSGSDAFGLPAEQYAIQTGNHPATFTNTNIQKFKEQLLRMGLAEYKEIPVYWCEKLGTVLANEEIKNIAGKKVSERGSFPVLRIFALGEMVKKKIKKSSENLPVVIALTRLMRKKYHRPRYPLQVSPLFTEQESKKNWEVDFAFAKKYCLPTKGVIFIHFGMYAMWMDGSCGPPPENSAYLPLNSQAAQEIIKDWLPVDIYIGGQEHANLHLLYARSDGEKMSKSRGNIVNPDELVEEYGADALRLYEIFLGPPDQTTSFDINDRVYNLFTLHREKFTTNSENSELTTYYQETLKKVSDYYQNIKLNLVVSSLMTFINECYKVNSIPVDYALTFCQLLNPLAPHISEEL